MQIAETKTCPRCNAEVAIDANFCTKCGAKLDRAKIRKEAKGNNINHDSKIEMKSSPLSSLSLDKFVKTSNFASSSPAAREKVDYWTPQRMKALIFSIASAIGIILTAIGLWLTSSLRSSLPDFYGSQLDSLRFVLFGLIVVIGSLFFMTLMEARSNEK